MSRQINASDIAGAASLGLGLVRAGDTIQVKLGANVTAVDGALTVTFPTGGGGDGGVSAIEVPALHKTIAATTVKDAALAILLYQVTDPADLGNLLLLSLELSYEDVIGSKFTYEIWSGDPAAPGSSKLASAGQDIFFTRYDTVFSSSATAYLDNAALRVGLYLNVINRLTSPLTFSGKLQFLKLPPVANPVILPPFNPTPFVYTGPSPLTVTDIGPGQTFPEIADALPYMIVGAFTMNVHAGALFKPTYIGQGYDGFTIKAAPGVTADNIACNGRGGWVTGYPRWTTNDPPGDGPANPFRLARGKAFILTNSPGTIEGLGFWYCGGGYNVNLPGNEGDGEAGVYAENFAAPGTLTVRRCTFDGNENGVFVPSAINEDGTAGPGANVTLVIDRTSFSYQVPNGQSIDGLSHNFYCNGAVTQVTNSTMYGCLGNSAKSRSPIFITLDSYYEADAGRCLDYPNGGSLTATRVVFSQKPGANLNFFGMSQEFQTNGDGHAKFIDSVMKIWRLDTSFLFRGATTQADFAPAGEIPSRVEWYPDAAFPGQRLGWNYTANQYGVVGLPQDSTLGGTIVLGQPSRPAPAHLS